MADGHLNHCKACRNAYSVVWSDRNREKRRLSARTYAAKVLDKNREYRRTWAAETGAYKRYYEFQKADPNQWAKRMARDAKRRAAKKRCVAKWANEFFIAEAYDLAQRRSRMTGFKWHVDHIVPMQSDLVCGLHVEHNLQVIPAVINHSKNNRYWPDMPVAELRIDD